MALRNCPNPQCKAMISDTVTDCPKCGLYRPFDEEVQSGRQRRFAAYKESCRCYECKALLPKRGEDLSFGLNDTNGLHHRSTYCLLQLNTTCAKCGATTHFSCNTCGKDISEGGLDI